MMIHIIDLIYINQICIIPTSLNTWVYPPGSGSESMGMVGFFNSKSLYCWFDYSFKNFLSKDSLYFTVATSQNAPTMPEMMRA